MGKASYGGLDRECAGLPTNDHESLIQRYIDNGFSKYGFTLFFKAAVLNRISDHKVNVLELFRELQPKQSKNVINCKLKRIVEKQLSMTPKTKPDEEFCCESFESNGSCDGCNECLVPNDIYSETCDGISVDEFMDMFRVRFAVIPDCWRINERGDFEIMEVKDSSEVPFRKIMKLAKMDELLHANFKRIRLNLYEHYIESDFVVTHDLNLAFDMCEIWFRYISKADNDRKMLREYRKGLSSIGRVLLPSDMPVISIA